MQVSYVTYFSLKSTLLWKYFQLSVFIKLSHTLTTFPSGNGKKNFGPALLLKATCKVGIKLHKNFKNLKHRDALCSLS